MLIVDFIIIILQFIIVNLIVYNAKIRIHVHLGIALTIQIL